jgi:hypothetical protein
VPDRLTVDVQKDANLQAGDLEQALAACLVLTLNKLVMF